MVMTPSSISSSSPRNSKDEEIATTAIAIDKDRNSEFAVRWAVDNLLKKSSNVFLVHVKTQSVQSSTYPLPLISFAMIMELLLGGKWIINMEWYGRKRYDLVQVNLLW